MCCASKLVPPRQIDLALGLQFEEPAGRLDAAGHGVVPPMELNEIERAPSEPLQRRVDDPADVGAVRLRQSGEIRHALGVDLQALQRGASVLCAMLASRHRADQFLHTGVDVGAVEGE